MAASYLDGIRLGKSIAMGGSLPESDFGVGPLDKVKDGPKTGATVMKDSQRSAPVGSNQANPHHGDI